MWSHVPREPGCRVWRLNRKCTFEVDFIQEVTFFTPEGIYPLDLECSGAGRDPRCADSRYLENLYASMARFEK